MKLILLILLAHWTALAQASQAYRIEKKSGCNIKKFEDGKYTNAPIEDFEHRIIIAKPHSKDPRFLIIKEEGELFVTRVECMKIVSDDDAPPPPVAEVKKKKKKKKKYDKNQFEDISTNWLIGIEGGFSFFPGQESIFPDYSLLDGTYDGQVFAYDKEANKSNYTGGLLYSLTLAKRASERRFFGLKFKKYSGKKSEAVNLRVDGSPQTMTVNFKEDFYSLLFGWKFIFFNNSSIRPSLGFYFGGNFIKSESLVESTSTGGAVELDLGLEIYLNENVSLGLNSGAEFLGQRTFVFKNEDTNENLKFKSNLDYSNFFATAGLNFYF
jgi:hypothetical protein